MNNKQNLLHWANLLYLAIVVASLSITQGPPPSWLDPAVAMVVAQVGLILIPTLVFVWLAGVPLKEMLKLRLLDIRSGVKCFLLGLTCLPFFILLGTLTQILLALINPARAGDTTSILTQAGSPWFAFLGMVVVAPFVEEALCRGVLLTIYESRFAAHAVWLVGILFALLHPSLDQVLGALFVGTVAGWVVYRTRSIWSGVLVHIGANLVPASLVLLVSLAVPSGAEGMAQAGDPGSLVWISVLVWGAFSLLMLLPWYFLIRSVGKHHPAPDMPEGPLRLDSAWSFAALVVGMLVYSAFGLLQR